MADRITQAPVQVVASATPAPPARLTQLVIMAVIVGGPAGRITQLPIATVFPLEPVAPKAIIPAWPVEETWNWKTTVAKTLSGREQRMLLRGDPFVVSSFNLPLLSDADRQKLLYTLHRHIGRRLNYPLFQYTTRLTATAAMGASALTFNPALSNMRDGEPVAVFDDNAEYFRILETGAVTGTGIDLAAALDEALTAGLFVAPAPSCRIADGQQISMATFSGAGQIAFQVVAPRDLLRPDEAAPLTTFDGMAVLPDRFVTGQGVSEGMTKNLIVTEVEQMDAAEKATWYNPQWSSSRRYRFEKTELDDWRKFGAAIGGMQSPFLAPSFRDDFRLNATPALGSLILTTGETFVADYFAYKANRYLRIVTANGVIYRKVAEARLETDRTVSIRLTAAIGASAGDNQIEMISIVQKVRLADDAMTLTHFINQAEISFGIATVNE